MNAVRSDVIFMFIMLRRVRTRAHVRMHTCDSRPCAHMRTVSRARALRVHVRACARVYARMQDDELSVVPVSKC